MGNQMKKADSAKITNYFFDLSKMFVVYLIIFQIFTQPMAALAQSRGVMQTAQSQNGFNKSAKSNIKSKTEDFSFGEIIPNLENKTRQAVSNALGVDIPFPQVFGENGKLNALFSGKNASADKNKDLIDSALNNGNKSNAKSNPAKDFKQSEETAISLNAPVLNAGSIDGSLRVLKEIPFNINDNFYISENLYTAGSPDISTGRNSEIKTIINDEGDDLFGNYPLYLNGGKIGGNIFIHSSAANIFEDIPTALPKPSGRENIEINSLSDLKAVKDWKSVKSLTINTEGLTIEVPAGNYERISLNAPNKLVFSHGNYNFTDTINLSKGSEIIFNGRSTVGIGKNLFIEDGSIKAGETVSPADVKINVLGSSVILSGNTEIKGFVRATNANVIVNENSKISGQVIAGSLVMNGGTIAGNTETNNRVFGLKQYDRTSGPPNVYTDSFVRNKCKAPYQLKIYNGNPGGGNRVSSATVKLNGSTVVAQNAFNQNISYIERTVNLNANNNLEVRVTSGPGSYFNLEIVGTDCGSADTIPPTLSITSPQNNSVTTGTAISMQGTASDNEGISQVLVNNTQANYFPADNTWNLENFPLNLGANQITVKAIDNAGNQTTQSITITRQPPVVDTTPPVLIISSPADNSTTQAQTITVSGSAADAEPNASGLASVTVNGENVNLSVNGNWTISDVALNTGSNTITARAADNAGNISTQVITVIREESDTTPPSLEITSPDNNSETTNSTISVSGTVSDTGSNPSGVASVTVNGQSAAINGNSWTIENIALTTGANVITANAIDNAGNSSSRQITVTRIESDTTAPSVTISSPANNTETNDAAVSVSGTATDPGANASGVASVTVNGQNAAYNNGSWSITNVALSVGSNTITVRATDNAGNEVGIINYRDSPRSQIRKLRRFRSLRRLIILKRSMVQSRLRERWLTAE